MKTKLLKRLRREADTAIKQPTGPYLTRWSYGVYWHNYFIRKRNYILRRVAELKQKRK